MLENYLIVITFSLIGGLFSLIGGVIMLSRKGLAEKLAMYSTPFAAGALLAAGVLELLPESVEKISDGNPYMWVLFGILIFFLLEHFLHWFHHNHKHQDKHDSSVAMLIIIGDSIHNFIDGIAIGAAFLINIPSGIVVTLAVASHEIPQEIGDFGLLLKHGFARKKVILINIISAVMATVGAILTYWIGSEASLPIGEILAITAGLFIYIAASDLIPAIHDDPKQKSPNYTAALLLILGVIVVSVSTNIAHNYLDPINHSHSTEQNSDHELDEHDEPDVH